jgi:hypothetical protein
MADASAEVESERPPSIVTEKQRLQAAKEREKKQKAREKKKNSVKIDESKNKIKKIPRKKKEAVVEIKKDEEQLPPNEFAVKVFPPGTLKEKEDVVVPLPDYTITQVPHGSASAPPQPLDTPPAPVRSRVRSAPPDACAPPLRPTPKSLHDLFISADPYYRVKLTAAGAVAGGALAFVYAPTVALAMLDLMKR